MKQQRKPNRRQKLKLRKPHNLKLRSPKAQQIQNTSADAGDIMTIAMSADIEADEAPAARSGGGAAAFKADASFCRYKADLNGNNELLAELTEKIRRGF